MDGLLFKDDVDPKEIEMLTNLTWALLVIFKLEAAAIGETVTVTSIRDRAKNRVSQTHKEGRAVDIRSRDWSYDPQKFCDEFNEKYKRFGQDLTGAVVQKPCFYHDNGGGWHFHLQTLRQ